jgi:hypothetical protein
MSIYLEILRRVHGTVLLAPCVAAVLAGCRPTQASNEAAGDKRAGLADTVAFAAPPQLGAVAPQSQNSTQSGELGLRRPSSGDTSARVHLKANIPSDLGRSETMAEKSLSVALLLARPTNPLQRVRVSGVCLDQFHAVGSAGAPPVSRSDWQLQSGDRVVYVVGPMPATCSRGTTTISATVRVDTVQVGGRARPRVFLTIPK